MVHPQDRPSTTLSSRPTTVDSAFIPAESVSNQPGAPETALGHSTKPQSELIRKADAVLQGELESRTSRGMGVLPGNDLPGSQDLETTPEPLRQHPGTLVDAFMDVPKHRPEPLAQNASQFTRIEKLHSEEDFQPILS